MQPVATVVSFRLGGTDGVSVEAAKWMAALAALGFAVRRVAGEIAGAALPGDRLVPGLSITPSVPAGHDEVAAAIEGSDLVVVENLLSLPLNRSAAAVVAGVLADHPRVVLHHHDLAWQRREYVDVAPWPLPLPTAIHVVINDRSRRELGERGIDATTIPNHFDLDPPAGDRHGTRARLGVAADDVLVLHPVRAIPRKNVPGALALCEELRARLPARRTWYWLPGPAEDGYAAELDALLAASAERGAVDVLRAAPPSMPDAYAAADLVVFPSTWEGFGNPVIESVVARRPLAVGNYPVLSEVTDLGFEFLPADGPDEVAAVVSGMRELTPVFDANLALARRHFSLDLLPSRLAALLEGAGWEVPSARPAHQSATAEVR
ncbi:MAG TPA: glycosyltransferase [Acidimicrobiia bacterium]|nr:glycosyltransferase [Acidimicrobiia bacterium]